MAQYILIYHYSSSSSIDCVDPQYYGTGVSAISECKFGKKGLNKSYFYIEDRPETCVRSKNRYEIYLPKEWKDLVYDLSEDKEELYHQVKQSISNKFNRVAYEYEVKEEIEKLIFEKGYKGFYASKFEPLSHAIVLFEKLSTKKPRGNYQVFDWNNTLLEKNENNYIPVSIFNRKIIHQNSNEVLSQLPRALKV